MMQGGLLIGGILMVTIGGVMLGIGIYLSGTLFGTLNQETAVFREPYNLTNFPGVYNGSYTQAGTAMQSAQTNTFIAYNILGIALIVAGFSVIIGTLLSMVSY